MGKNRIAAFIELLLLIGSFILVVYLFKNHQDKEVLVKKTEWIIKVWDLERNIDTISYCRTTHISYTPDIYIKTYEKDIFLSQVYPTLVCGIYRGREDNIVVGVSRFKILSFQEHPSYRTTNKIYYK